MPLRLAAGTLRNLLAGACLLACALFATAAPFDKWIEFAQPNGETVILHGQGDEFSARFETADGFTVIFDKARKAYCFAQADASGDLVSSGVLVGVGKQAPQGTQPGLRMGVEKRRELISTNFARWEEGMQIRPRWEALKATARQHYNPDPNGPQMSPPPFTTVGLKVGLTMLIDFSDVPSTVPQAEIVNYLNGDNYTGYGNNGSVKKYYQDNSDGLLTYTNVVTIYVRAPQPKSFYADVTKDCGSQANLLIKDCVGVLKSLPNYQSEILPLFDALTTDAQNRVVAFNVFYAGGDGGVWMGGLWPHSWALVEVGEQELSPGGKKLWRYQVTNIGNSLAIATFCHENGHMLCGYPDIYDYEYDSSGGAGMFCLMNSGGHGPNPVQICAYLKRASGWASVTELTASSSTIGTLSSAGQNFNHFYRLQKPGVPTEYYLLENRQRQGRDANIPASGIAIWHCDELGDRDNQSTAYNTSHANYEVTLVQADNKWDLQANRNDGDAMDLYYAGNTAAAFTGEFSDDSQPSARWWDGTRSGLMFADFSPSGQDMTFRAGFGMSVKIASVEVTGGNGNGVMDPNECNQLMIGVYNDSDIPVTGVTARLSTSTPGVIIAQPLSAYQDIAGRGTNMNLTAFQVSVAPWFICGTPIDFTLSVRTDQGTGASQFRLHSGMPGSPLPFSSTTFAAIPDNWPNGTNSYVTVTNLTGALVKATVGVFIQHTWVGDLKLQLVSPGGITNTLSEYNGSSGNNYGLSCVQQTVFDDASSFPIASGAPPFVGAFSPDEPLAVFQGLSGTNLNGQWALHVVDDAGADIGSIVCWSLNLTMPQCQDGGGECPGSDLGVSVTAAPNPSIIGQALNYYISVTNRGPSTAKSAILTHVLPPGAVVNSIQPSQGSASQAGGVITCNLGSMRALGSATMAVRITPTVPGTSSSSVTVSSEQPDFSPADNSVTIQTQVNPPTADLALGLNAIPSSLVVGESLTLTIGVTNNGPSTASPVLVTNVLPAALALTGSSIGQGGSVTAASNVVVCSFGALTNGARAFATLQLQAKAEGQVYIQSSAIANQFDPISANSSAAVLVAVGPAADLAVTVLDTPDPVLVDGTFTWQTTVSNNGPSDATGVALTENLPAAATVISSSSSHGVVTIANGVLTCNIGDLLKNSSVTVSVQMRAAAAGILSGSAHVTGTQADVNTANNTVTVSTTVSAPFINVVAGGSTLLSEGIPNGAIDIGETNTIVLRLKNVGNITTTNLVARLVAGGGITPIGIAEQHYGVLSPSGWPVGKPFTFVASGANGATVTATLELQDGTATYPPVTFTFPLPNVFHFANGAEITIPSLGNAAPYPSTLNVSGVSGLVSKVTATISNFNHSFPKDVDVLLVAPDGTASLLMSHAGKANPSAVTLTFDDTAASAISTTSQLLSGSWKPSNYTPTPVFPAPAPQSFESALSAFNSHNPNGQWALYVIDDHSGDAGAIHQGWSLTVETISPINQVADLSVAGTAAPAPVTAGSDLSFTFSITNAGPDTANAVTFTNAIPQNAAFVSASSSQGSVSVADGSLVAALGSMPVGAVAAVQLVLNPGAAAAGTLAISGSVVANETDLNQLKNTAAVSAAVNLPSADIAFAQSAAAQVLAGQNVELTLAVTNRGPGLSLDTTVTNLIPAGMSFVSGNAAQGALSAASGVAVWQIGNLAAGQQAVASVVLKALTEGARANSATAYTRSVDGNPVDNSSTLTIDVVAPKPLITLAAKRLSAEQFAPANGTIEAGEAVTLELGLANTGSADAGSIVVGILPCDGIVVSGPTAQAYGAIAMGAPAVFKPFSFTATGAPGTLFTLQFRIQNGTTDLGIISVEFALPSSATYANTSAIQIPEMGSSVPYPSSIVITNARGVVKSAVVSLNGITHSFPRDLTIVLVSPSGRSTTLMSGAGDAKKLQNVNLTLDDVAPDNLPQNDQITTGTWKPTAFGAVSSLPAPAPAAPYGTSFAALAGSPANGTWSLFVNDNTSGDGGAISNGWTLTLSTLDAVNPVADLSISLVSSPASLLVGDRCTNYITLVNAGPSAAENVTVTGTLPFGASVVQVSQNTGTAQATSNIVWTIPSMPAGSSALCEVVYQVLATGAFTCSASVTSLATDMDLANNTSQSPLNIGGIVAPTLTATVSNGVCQLIITGEPGVAYTTQWSSNLASWSDLVTSTIPQTGVLKIVDPQPATSGARFYRILRATRF